MLGGFLAERYGGKWVLGIALLSTALFTFMTPFTIRTGGVTWLFILRVLEGISEVRLLTHLFLSSLDQHSQQ